MQIAKIYPLLTRELDKFTPIEGMDPSQSDWDWGRLIQGQNKAPKGLGDYSETTVLKFKDGSSRKVIRQKAARPGREGLASWLARHPWWDFRPAA